MNGVWACQRLFHRYKREERIEIFEAIGLLNLEFNPGEIKKEARLFFFSFIEDIVDVSHCFILSCTT